MSISIISTIPKAGRAYTVNLNGAQNVVQRYQLILSAPLDIDELPTSFTGVPAINSVHPNRPGFYVSQYKVVQPDGAAKNTLDIDVYYAPTDYTSGDPSSPTPTPDSTITEWGWDDGTGEKELVVDIDGVDVVNSAKDPFDSVPSVFAPTPTFVKVVKFSTRQSYASYLCTVNDSQITIGGMSCAKGTLLCTVSERRLIGESIFPYEYTVRLRYRSNQVNESGSITELGWQLALVDAGMRELKNGIPEFIQTNSSETGQPVNITSPALLDGQGHSLISVASASGTIPDPVYLMFKAYAETSFPPWFYSEPSIPTTPTT
ncbi:MAG: hypothetical protein IJQ34_02210 [Kiritimatiellae bacterium]|nr:hypothetical protein [Kiritimatiellia bacterium]